ncbi:MAG: S24/S26 family peptidase [Caldilineales bacterium]
MIDVDSAGQPDLPQLHSWLPLLQESLLRERVFRWQLTGKSMEPTLPSGCEIEIVPLPARLPLGTVVVFANGSTLVAHRLVHRSRGHLVTQGDGRRQPDRWLVPAQLVGLVDKARIDGRLVWPGRGEGVRRWRWIGRAYALAGLRRLRHLLPFSGWGTQA